MPAPTFPRDPLVSVILLCHNYSHYLPEAFGSIQSQTFRDFEILVIDSGSTDDTASVARRLAEDDKSGIPIRLFCKENVGPSIGRNFGVSQARGRYFLPLDGDDKIAPEYLAKAVPLLEANPKLGFVYPQVSEFGDRQGIPCWVRPYDFSQLCRGNLVPNCTLVRKEAFEAVGGYDPENFGYYEDWQLWIRLGAKGWHGQLLNEPLFHYRHHFKSSLSYSAQRLEPMYRAYIISHEPSVYSREEVEAAQRLLKEMPTGWHRRPPMRDVGELEGLLRENPDNKHLMFFLALACEKAARREEAVRLLRRLLRRHPDDIQAAELLGRITDSHSAAVVLDRANPNYANTPVSPSRPRLNYRSADPAAPPVVSIVTPFFNADATFHETAESVFRQSLQQWEWIIVNDGSSEAESLRILDEYRHKDPRIRVIDHSQNRGPGAARNTGFREARAEFVFQLDADDLIEPTTLEKMAWHLTAHPEVAFTSGFAVGFGASEYLSPNGFHLGSRCLNEKLVTSTCLVRKSVHQAIGGYDEKIRGGCEDWDFWLKAASSGHWGTTVMEFLGWYRRRGALGQQWENVSDKQKAGAFRARLRQRYPGLWERFPMVIPAHRPLDKSFSGEVPFANRLTKEKRRLLLIIPHLEPGGSDKFNLDLIRQLQKTQDWEISIVTTRIGRDLWQHEFQSLTPDVFVLHHFLHFSDYPLFLRYLIGSRQPDVVCVTHSHIGYQLLPYLRSYFPDLPFVDYLHIEEEKWLAGGYPRFSILYQSQLARTAVSSEHLKHWMVERGGDAARIDVCYTNIDTEEWSRSKPEPASTSGENNHKPRTPVILYAARICDQKQPMVFAEVIRRLAQRHPDFVALVAGDGPDMPKLKEFVQREKLHQVRFLGLVSGAAMRELLAVSDIFLLPSQWEGISLAVYEAMAMEVVPVVADVGGQRELVTPDCGILVERGAEEAADYARALQKLLDAPERLRQMGQAGRRRVSERFHINDLGRRANEVFNQACAICSAAPAQHVMDREQANLHMTEVIEQLRMGDVADEYNRKSQHLVSYAKYSIEWQSALRTGQALADLKQPAAAIRLLQDGVASAAASGQPNVELAARIEISKAMIPLDCRLAETILAGALPLAELLSSSEVRQTVEQGLKKLTTMLKGAPSQKSARNISEPPAQPAPRNTIPAQLPAVALNNTMSVSAVSDKPRRRITYLISSILGVTGGNQTLLRQAEEMRRRGHDVTIVTYSPKPDWFRFETRVIQVPAGQAMATCVPPSDVVVATYFTNAMELRAITAPVKVYYAQGDQYVFADSSMAATEQNRHLRELSRASYQMPGIRFVPNSHNLARAVEKLCGRKADAILPVCTDQTIFRPLQRSLPGSRLRLLIVGPDARGTEAEPLLFKGIQDIHNALQILNQRYPHFSAVRMSNTPPDIFARFPCEFYIAPGDEMKTVLFGASHILIYASHYDSCPRPPQEAMAAGCAVVCTATGGAMEYCRDGENSLLVPVQSPAAIADAVERLIKDHELREKLIQGGLATAREYPREREWNEWETILQRFVGEATGHADKTGTGKTLAAKSVGPAKPVKAAAIELPPCGLVGHIGEARKLVQRNKFRDAWESAQAALTVRPFHPEAYLLLAEIARAAGNSTSARSCAEHARRLAPDWKPARQFLNQSLKGNARLDWLSLPAVVADHASPLATRLTVCLIARNEEKFLARCLTSVRGFADQIVVVDTGSTDRTVEIAREYGAEVHSFTWCDDFSAARNSALEHANGDWVLMLDADEELSAESREVIRQAMQAENVMAYRLRIIDIGREEEGCSYVPRLFRNAPGLFYVGRIHEQVFSSVEVRRKQWGLENRLSTATLIHHGYTQEVVVDRDKRARNLRLLELAIQEMPDEPNLLMNYGMELARVGRLDEGLENYREAFRILQAKPPEQVVPELRESLLTQLCTQLIAAKRFEELVHLMQEPLAQRDGVTASVHFGLGLAYMQLGRHEEAINEFQQCLAKRDQPSLSPTNRDIRKAGPHHCIARCHNALQQFDAAEKAFQAAQSADPSSVPVRFDYATFLWQRGQPLEAVKILHSLLTEQGNLLPVWLLGGQITLSQPRFVDFACDWTGEAIKHFPEDRMIALQHAEALLARGRFAQALPVWRQVGTRENPAHHAAQILCEIGAGESASAVGRDIEPAVSREFLKWYQRLLAAGQLSAIASVDERLPELSGILPSAVKTVETAKASLEAASAS
ncbi:MAG TPA: glycosyltransferase [Verrucomicrobiae bacterium]|nr:glycosyltransferase [Verrucomicrobiae bacterium]